MTRKTTHGSATYWRLLLLPICRGIFYNKLVVSWPSGGTLAKDLTGWCRMQFWGCRILERLCQPLLDHHEEAFQEEKKKTPCSLSLKRSSRLNALSCYYFFVCLHFRIRFYLRKQRNTTFFKGSSEERKVECLNFSIFLRGRKSFDDFRPHEITLYRTQNKSCFYLRPDLFGFL